MSVGQPYQPSVNGTTILVLGILSIVFLPILGPVAWIMGNNALVTLNSGYADQSQRSNVVAGRICGIIGTVVLILGIIYVIAMMTFGLTLMKQFGSMAPVPVQTGASNPFGAQPVTTSASGSGSLTNAIMMNDDAKLTAMLDKDPTLVNKKDATNNTPLFDAVFFGNKKTVSILIDHGADVNAQNDFGQRPLDRARAFHKDDIAALLVGKGAVAGKKQ
jgi:hypothetical protein